MDMYFTQKDIAHRIDHALLRPDMTLEEVRAGCEAAAAFGTASVCVRGSDVALCASMLKGSGVAVGTVVGFPHGASAACVKAYEAQTAVSHGAREIDMVVNIARVKSGDYIYAGHEIRDILDVCRGEGALLKVIFENCYLSRDEIIALCKLCSEARVDYIKTSTGFGPYGARAEDVRLMRAYASPEVKIKAAGGIKTLDDLLAFVQAGADRIGTSATAAILAQAGAVKSETEDNGH
jgi:deoxyribose-phosphate aldolase